MLYLDNAATTFKKPFCVYRSMIYNTIRNSVNAGHGGHYYSIKGAKGVYNTAEKIAGMLNVTNPERIAFTQNATYAINLGIRGIIGSEDHVVTTCMEHNSVLRTLNGLCEYTMVNADCEGMVSPDDIEKAIRAETKLIVVNHASNVCGTIQKIKEISKIARKHKIPFMVDASQSIGVIDFDVDGIDMLAFSGHKGLMAPMGVGVLYVADGIKLKPVITGGTGSESKNLNQPEIMPDMLQSGTLNTPAIMACGTAVDYIMEKGIKEIEEWEMYLALRFIEKIREIKNVKIYGKKGMGERNGTVAFNIGKMDSTETASLLNDEFSIAVRGGWHCAYPAHCAVGSKEKGAVRASFGLFNTIYSADKLADAVYKISKMCE